MVLMEAPPHGVNSKPQVIDYYVKTLERVLGSEKDAQMCIYDASWDTHFGFCCDIDEETSHELAIICQAHRIGSTLLFPVGNTKHWLVRLDKPGVGVVTKAQMVDYYAQILTKSNFGFCCELDDECARELAGVPGVLSVQPDKNFESENKDYGDFIVDAVLCSRDESFHWLDLGIGLGKAL
uniref:MORF/ORRM1/DAG-like MORF domain-containing protein n=1 Tax=Fagus sylvatica TaxID=28930 RepID=A0A2N9J2K9_FAGSY